MGLNTKIEWTATVHADGSVTAGATWNPIRAKRKDDGKVGWHCERISEGCRHCYAAAQNGRRLPGGGTGLDYTRTSRAQVDVFVDEEMLSRPVRWRRARKVFVCSMTDLFAEFVTDAQIDRVFSIMYDCHWHAFMVLTKRADRMLQYLSDSGTRHTRIGCESYDHLQRRKPNGIVHNAEIVADVAANWPLPNVWLGVSVERQQEADARIPLLLKCPAALRWLSVEPQLEEIDLQLDAGYESGGPQGWVPGVQPDFVVQGGESGPKARVFDVAWARSMRDQCRQEGTPYFLKQLGSRPFDSFYRAGVSDQRLYLKDRKGGNPAEWPADLQNCRDLPRVEVALFA